MATVTPGRPPAAGSRTIRTVFSNKFDGMPRTEKSIYVEGRVETNATDGQKTVGTHIRKPGSYMALQGVTAKEIVLPATARVPTRPVNP